MAPPPDAIDPGLLKLDPYTYLDVPEETAADDDPPPPPEPDNPDARDVPAPENTAKAKAEKSAKADAAAKQLSPQPIGATQQPCPLHAKEWLLVRVIGDKDTPMPDITVKLTKSDGEIVGKTRADGVIEFSGLEKGSYGISLPEHDLSAWSFSSSGAPATPPGTPAGPATFYEPAAADATDDHHTVASGECMTTIAAMYGWAPQELWKHEANAALNEQRGHLRTLVVGDDVVIPARRARSIDKPTGQQHTLKLVGVPAFLKLQIQSDGKPRKNEPYLLDVDGRTTRGQTDAEGNISVPIIPGMRSGRLDVGPSSAPDRYELLFAQLEPASTTQGARQRLANLGYLAPDSDEDEAGEDDGQDADDPAFAAALAAFQKDRGLKQTGAMDQNTQSALEKSYGDT